MSFLLSEAIFHLYRMHCNNFLFYFIFEKNVLAVYGYDSDEVAVDTAKFGLRRNLPAVSVQLLNEVFISVFVATCTA